MTESIRQTLLLVVAGGLAVFAMTAALMTEKRNDVEHKALQPDEQDVSVRVIADDGTVIMFSDCEAKQESDGTITIKARSKGNL